MKMKDRHSKGDAREMQGRWQALGRLMEQLRSSLGASKEQARSRLEYGKGMGRVWQEHLLVRPERTLGTSGAHSQSVGGVLHTLRYVVLLMMVMMGVNAWGQTDYSGVYYIGVYGKNSTSQYASGTPANNYYLCPTEGWCYYNGVNNDNKGEVTSEDNGKPFLTSYKCRGDNNYDKTKAVWVITKHPTEDYYYIQQQKTEKYLLFNVQLNDAGVNRVRVHLETITPPAVPDDNALFAISTVTTNDDRNGYWLFHPKNANEGFYLNITDGNVNSYSTPSSGKTDGPKGYKNVGGIIGQWNEPNNTSSFYLEKAAVDAPTITNNFDGTFTITTTETGATIYYTTDGTTPTTSSTSTSTTENSITFDQTESMTVIKAIAKGTNDDFSSIVTTYNIPKCSKPTFTQVDENHVTISCSTSGATITYGVNSAPTSPYTLGNEIDISTATVVKAKAIAPGYIYSDEASCYHQVEVHNSSAIDNMDGSYLLASDFVSTTTIGTSDAPFKGVIDGQFHTIYESSAIDHPLVAYADGAIIKNVVIGKVNITSGTNVGAICNEASGDTKIYNCGVLSGSVSGSGNIGGLVGLLDGSARVINCFSYANITGGDLVGGIVGKNNVATTSAVENLKTMVMNCMFYGNITGGTSKAPIYNGEIISNTGNTGVGNYNYFLADATFTGGIDKYNCALMAEKRFLQRFEFFRHLLNSHRELAAWWATGDYSNKDEMAKWVMEPSQIGTSTPYPILKTPGKYASVVNYTPNETAYDEEHRNEGRKLTTIGIDGKLSVTIQMGTGGAQYSAPTGARLKPGQSATFDLTITDKDFEHFNFNYGKVQLPYYNDYCDGNYTGNRVVTGWKIVSITTDGSVASYNSYTTGDDATATITTENDETKVTLSTPYNFADRKCTAKDLYETSGRVFNQGAYWDVPEGVTSITIQPYWAKCVYLADANADVVYNTDMTIPYLVPNVGGGTGTLYTNGGENQFNGQKVYTALTGSGGAIDSNVLGASSSHTVYDYAVVLVGNFHHYGDIAADNKPYTVTSVDLDGDNEPDYSFMLRFDGRKSFHPVRYDFINLMGLGMAQKSTGSNGSFNFGIPQPKYWFEVTNTALFRVTQMEYDAAAQDDFPIILQGGVIEQWVSGQSALQNKVKYIHVGSNVWFKEFHLGCHQDKSDKSTKHPPVSVTGGDYGEFYLTGLYATTINYNDNAECYINGGRFGKVAGAGIEGIGSAGSNGNIVWQIQNADIEEFYGGGINAAKPIEGSITTVITGSHVKRFCGGPKFGDLNSGRTVITTATNCTFGSFFGAGYGGNSYYRAAPGNFTGSANYSWNDWIAGNTKGNVGGGNYSNGVTYKGYKQDYISNFGGVSTRFDYQFLPQSDNVNNVGRLFIDFVNFSLATTHNVTSTLTGCTITGNFYGGGSLGKVDGDVTSTLTNCTVRGSVFGGGYDATRPTVQVLSTDGFTTPPNYNEETGVFFPAAEPYNTSIEYTWEHSETVNSTETAIDKDNHILYTTADLTTLGQVTGNVTLNISGNTLVEGQAVDYEGNLTGGDCGGVFGGGDASAVLGNTTVTINATALQEGATYNAYCVYGGGNIATVGGNSTVNLQGNTEVLGNVFGGGNKGPVEGSATVNIGDEEEEPAEP